MLVGGHRGYGLHACLKTSFALLCFGECAHEQHLRITLTLTLTHTITAYSVSGNVIRVRILICATRQKPCRKRVYQHFMQPLSIRNSRTQKNGCDAISVSDM